MLHCDLRVRWKVASDLRFQAAISEPGTPSFCGISGDLAPSTRKSLAIAIVRFWCAKCSGFDKGLLILQLRFGHKQLSINPSKTTMASQILLCGLEPLVWKFLICAAFCQFWGSLGDDVKRTFLCRQAPLNHVVEWEFPRETPSEATVE